MREDMGFKSFFSTLKSMRFGLLLLGLLGLISVIGSTIPQGQAEHFYYERFSEGRASLILQFGFNDIYNSLYFKALFVALCVNLMLCSVLRFKSIVNSITRISWKEEEDRIDSYTLKKIEDVNGFVEEKLKSFGYNNITMKLIGEKKVYFSKRHSIGYFGSWLIHLGFLIVIVAYAYGQYGNFTSAIYGVPGSVKPLEDTGINAAIKGFNVEFRQDGSINQYYTQLELLDDNGNILATDQLFVNKPLRYDGYSFYQTATGWAADITILKNGVAINEELLYEGTTYLNEKEEIALQFNKLYPDYIQTPSGISSQSQQPNNPKILYSIFNNGNRIEMNIASPGERISWQEYEFVFDNIDRYTYLQVNRMPGKLAALIGSILIMVGLYLAFYLKPKYIVAVIEGNNLEFYGNDIMTRKEVNKNTSIKL